ncbi:MAG: nucleoside recognition protein [Clostridia bacterium]|nr:nucleoside recognition protein [Clostridia bacterium]MBR3199465.1 nucleoside recognition protein [Bacilli bacterium]
MLNKIWPLFIIFSIFYAVLFGNIQEINSAIFDSTENAITITISLVGTMCLWSGIMKIACSTSLINKLCRILNPILNFLFPDIKNSKKIKKEISMNIISNFLGLGNAATPIGIKAMQSMNNENNKIKNAEKNKYNKLSNSMKMFILINTASIQLIPTTIFSIRKSLGSKNPTQIIVPVWLATICAALSGIFCLKLLIKREK